VQLKNATLMHVCVLNVLQEFTTIIFSVSKTSSQILISAIVRQLVVR